MNDNSKLRSEAIYKSKQNGNKAEGLKILTPKQLIQRYTLYQSKQITKKVYNNIIKSI